MLSLYLMLQLCSVPSVDLRRLIAVPMHDATRPFELASTTWTTMKGGLVARIHMQVINSNTRHSFL